MTPHEWLTRCIAYLSLQRWDVVMEMVEAVDDQDSNASIVIDEAAMRAYVRVKSALSGEELRETIVHEMVHLSLYEVCEFAGKLVRQKRNRDTRELLTEMLAGVEEQTTIRLTRAMVRMMEENDV